MRSVWKVRRNKRHLRINWLFFFSVCPKYNCVSKPPYILLYLSDSSHTHAFKLTRLEMYLSVSLNFWIWFSFWSGLEYNDFFLMIALKYPYPKGPTCTRILKDSFVNLTNVCLCNLLQITLLRLFLIECKLY